MKKIIPIVLLLFIGFSAKTQNEQNIYDFTVLDIEGKPFSFETLKGKKILIVNTASKCGLTPQYKDLQSLFDKYKDNNFVIIGFPANNFMSQEPGSNEDIAQFCEKNYGVTFLMMEKISVKGDDQHALYQFLTSKEKNGLSSEEVKWNFQKFLIDENGKLAKVVSPRTSPLDEEITTWIEQ